MGAAMLTKADLVAAAMDGLRAADRGGGYFEGSGESFSIDGNIRVWTLVDAILRMIIAKSDSPEVVAEIGRVLQGRAAFIPVATDAAGDAFADASRAQAFPCAPLD